MAVAVGEQKSKAEETKARGQIKKFLEVSIFPKRKAAIKKSKKSDLNVNKSTLFFES